MVDRAPGEIFAFVSKEQFATDLHKTLASASHSYYNYIKSGVTFDVLSARYISAFRALRLADKNTTETRMVSYLIDNLPATDLFRDARAKLKSRSTLDPEVVEARKCLSSAIQFFNQEINLRQALDPDRNSFEMDSVDPTMTPPILGEKKAGGAAFPPEVQNPLILYIDKRFDQLERLEKRRRQKSNEKGLDNGKSPGKNSKTYDPVYKPCSNFVSNSCAFGDNCKFLHGVKGKPDHRLDQKGQFKQEYLISIGKKPNNVVLALQAQLQAVQAIQSPANKPSAFGYNHDDDL